MKVKIVAMKLHRDPGNPSHAPTLLATFDVHVGPVSIYQCGLVRRSQDNGGGFKITMPLRKHRMEKCGVAIPERTTRLEVERRALEAYDSLTGVNG